MKFTKKWVIFGLVLMVAITVFAGCGKTKTTDPKNTSDSTSTTVTQTIKLALWDYEVVGYDKSVVNEFSKQNPDIKVEVISAPNAEYENKLAVMLAAGEDLDVFYAKSTQAYPGLVLKNYLRPLDDLIAKDNINVKSYGTIVDLSLKMDNKLYALPYRSNLYMLFYNKDIFDQAKVPYPTNDMTWEDFRELGKKLTSGEGNDKTYGIFNIPRMNYYAPTWVQKTKGTDLVTSDLNALKDGIKLQLDIQDVDKSCPEYAFSKSMNADQLTFQKGRSAMMYNGIWFIQMLINDKKAGKYDFNWGVVKSPYWKGGEQTSFSTATPVCINAKTKKLDAAWELHKFITGKEGAKILAESMIMPGYIDDEVLSIYVNNPDIPEGTIDALKVDTIYVLTSPNKIASMVQKAIQEEAELVFTHNKSIDQAIADMTKRRKEILDQHK